METVFSDKDGSSIFLRQQQFFSGTTEQHGDIINAIIVPPKQLDIDLKRKNPSVSSLECVFLGTAGGSVSKLAIESILSWFTMSLHDKQRQIIVMGIDTETGSTKGVSLLQLCIFEAENKPGKILVANARSGAFPHIARMLSGQHGARPICAGAEVYGDILMMAAIEMKVFAALDISSMNDSTKTIGLRQMLDDKLGTEWVKDKTVTCSDWDQLPLNLPQLKYAALDAWASEILGRVMLQDQHPECFLPISAQNISPLQLLLNKGSEACLISSIIMPKSLAVALYAKLEEVQSYEDASKSEFEVPFDNICIDHDKKLQTRISLQSFQKRLRQRYKVEARIREKVFSGKVTKCAGRLCFVEWDTLDNARTVATHRGEVKLSSNNFNEMDRTMRAAKDGFYQFISHFHPPQVNNPLALNGSENCLVVSEVFDRNLLPVAVQQLISAKSSSIDIALALVFNAKRSLEAMALEAESVRRHRPKMKPMEDYLGRLRLNESQKEAIYNAVSSRVSLVRGPPGTGKTSTVASFSDLWTRHCRPQPPLKGAQMERNRVLILAPANAATLRVLESVVAANLRSVALVVSSDWMIEWHQDSVLAHLQPFVVTPHVLDHVKQKARQQTGEYAQKEGGGDLNDRALTQPPCKWDDVINVDATCENKNDIVMEVPDIVIMTHAFFMNMKQKETDRANLIKKKNQSADQKKSSQFQRAVSRLLCKETISAVVVDECSQMWEGHAISLFSKFAASTRFMLVGDDKQLPPFGSDNVNKSKKSHKNSIEASPTRSLFESAYAAFPRIPSTQLNVSYRLPKPVGEVVSAGLYGNQLAVVRNPARDEVVSKRFQSGNDLLHNDPSCRLACEILQQTRLNGNDKSLIWIDVKGDRSLVGNSKANVAEAEITANLACGLLKLIRRSEAAEGLQGEYDIDSAVAWGGVCDHDEEEEDDEESLLHGVHGKVNPHVHVATRDIDSTMSSEDEDDDTESSIQLGNFSIQGKASSTKSLLEAEDFAVKKSSEHLSSVNERMRLNVITPYEGQRATIEKNLCKKVSHQNINDVNNNDGGDNFARWVRSSRTVGNVDGLQGQEADVCIISPVVAPTAQGNEMVLQSLNSQHKPEMKTQLLSMKQSNKWKIPLPVSCGQTSTVPKQRPGTGQRGSSVRSMPAVAETDSPATASIHPDASKQRTESRAQLRTAQRQRSSVSLMRAVPETGSTTTASIHPGASKQRTESRGQRRTAQRQRGSSINSMATTSMVEQINAKYQQNAVRGRVRGSLIFAMPHEKVHWSTQKECRGCCERSGFRVLWVLNRWFITRK